MPDPVPDASLDASHDPSVVRFLETSKARVEGALDALLPPSGEGPPRLAEALRYSVEAGGKRIRPALAFASCRAVGGSEDDAVPYACALELVHTYSLIHDDLPAMDDDDLRRGRPTSHKVFGEALAILAGDALNTFAFHVLLAETPDSALARALGIELADAAGFEGMVGGQVDDLAGDEAEPDAARVLGIHARKTAALIRAACRGGGMCGGATDPQVDDLGTYGLELGLTFQIVDDILDEVGSAEALGKTPGADRREARLTYVAAWGLDGARDEADGHLERAIAAAERLPSPDLLVSLARYVRERDR